MMTKCCTICHVDQELSEFYANKAAKDGLHPYCKACCKIRVRARAARLTKTVIESKCCRICGVDQPATEFAKNSHAADGLQTRCRSCSRGLDLKSRNKVHAVPASKVCRDCLTDKVAAEFYRASTRTDGLTSRCRDCHKTMTKAWRVDNRHICRNNFRNYRAAKLQANCRGWDPELHDLVLLEADDLCQRLERSTGVQHQLDHVVPLQGKSVCGLHVWYNFQVLSRPANIRKSNRVV